MRLGAVLALLVGLLALAGCGGGGLVDPASADLSKGKQLFVSSCGACHTLADAKTQGKVGPNLDDAFAGDRAQGFDEDAFVQVVRDQIAFPGIGGAMQPDIVTGQDADDVAAYVGRYAGNRGIPPSPPVPSTQGGQAGATTGAGETQGGGGGGEAAGGSAEGKSIFTQNCATCHTLAAAGSSGTVGPNLDDLKPDKPTVVKQVTNGGGVMPAFKDTLSEAQIDAVAQFVSENAGK